VESHDRSKGGIFAEKGEGVPIVKKRKRGSERICKETVKERLYSTVEVTVDDTSIICGEKG